MESIELLQRLVDAVEKSGADIAPTYQEYMSMAFAIANSCGEQGRTYFHRLCRISEKYRPTDADKLYNNALKDGHRKNSLGSVWHLAEQAGVTIDMNLARLQDLFFPVGEIFFPNWEKKHRRLRRLSQIKILVFPCNPCLKHSSLIHYPFSIIHYPLSIPLCSRSYL